ncbi:uncharacterized protein LOC119377007, partial [Rhipicephalus sanguineus]|uniref:uncharacterized protein LOC119377007 n=1 Tax=Rhipicephalus sanguineus TaxID=34632 RepID=UPI0020C3679B
MRHHCKKCNKVFSSLEAFFKHTSYHDGSSRGVPCGIAGSEAAFKNYSSMRSHITRLTGVRLDEKLSNVPSDVALLLTSFFRSNTGNDALLDEWILKISQAEMSLGKSDAGTVVLIPLIVTYFKDDLSQITQVHEASTDITADFLDNLPVCTLIVALGKLFK